MSTKEPVSPWSYKPWSCQPWSILLVGVSLIGGSWMLLKTLWVTIVVLIPVSAWMGFFLLIWPQLIRESGILEVMEQPTSASTEKSGRGSNHNEYN